MSQIKLSLLLRLECTKKRIDKVCLHQSDWWMDNESSPSLFKFTYLFISLWIHFQTCLFFSTWQAEPVCWVIITLEFGSYVIGWDTKVTPQPTVYTKADYKARLTPFTDSCKNLGLLKVHNLRMLCQNALNTPAGVDVKQEQRNPSHLCIATSMVTMTLGQALCPDTLMKMFKVHSTPWLSILSFLFYMRLCFHCMSVDTQCVIPSPSSCSSPNHKIQKLG